ncbi:MAG: hypothetical protein EXQ49_11085 [Acidobacteria bacterium]|nr:hypothetical protein [Acidobacteriota bacterium]
MIPPARTWRILNLDMGVNEPERVLRERAATAAGVDLERVRGCRIARRSVDARVRGKSRRLRFIVHVDLVVDADYSGVRFDAAVRSGKIVEAPQPGSFLVANPTRGTGRVVVVGSGPAGLYAALVLSLNGVAVDVIDRGAELKERGRDVVRFHRTRTPNPESNLLFGEGGAGTYSDGKLYTRVDDPLEVPCLEELVACGAPPDILFDSRAHIGTDRLHKILPVLRGRMEARGVRFHWNTRLDGLVMDSCNTDDGASVRRVRAVRTSQGEMPCDALWLALGHSARDTVRLLHEQGLQVAAKPFQLGVRIEHPQELITRGRYGDGPDAARLGPASYSLICKAEGKIPASYSFCMCPGGTIVGSINTPGLLCTNGMSNSSHSSPWANAALVTTFGPAEYGAGPFAGVAFQEELERRFFEAGGADYTAPAQGADDFLAGRSTPKPRHSSYTLGTVPGRIDSLLPPLARKAIMRALLEYEHHIPGFRSAAGLLVGLESRSSGPVRMPRDRETALADGFANVYPMGEGAGQAGGIMSAAIDGARCALAYLQRSRRPA